MPKSKHRKNQKQKSIARTKRIKNEQATMQKRFKEEFMKQMEDFKNKEMNIEEVVPEESGDTNLNA